MRDDIATMLLDPAVIVIAGGLSEAGDALLEPLRTSLSEHLTWRPAPPVQRSSLGARAGLLGAASAVERTGSDALQVDGLDSAAIGVIAAREGIALIELTPQQATLEEAFMELTEDSIEYHGTTAEATNVTGAKS